MSTTVFGYHKKAYIAQVKKWAKRLEAEDVIIHKDGTVTLACRYGYICDHYQPTAAQLKGAENWKPEEDDWVPEISAEDYAEWCGKGWLY